LAPCPVGKGPTVFSIPSAFPHYLLTPLFWESNRSFRFPAAIGLSRAGGFGGESPTHSPRPWLPNRGPFMISLFLFFPGGKGLGRQVTAGIRPWPFFPSPLFSDFLHFRLICFFLKGPAFGTRNQSNVDGPLGAVFLGPLGPFWENFLGGGTDRQNPWENRENVTHRKNHGGIQRGKGTGFVWRREFFGDRAQPAKRIWPVPRRFFSVVPPFGWQSCNLLFFVFPRWLHACSPRRGPENILTFLRRRFFPMGRGPVPFPPIAF